MSLALLAEQEMLEAVQWREGERACLIEHLACNRAYRQAERLAYLPRLDINKLKMCNH